MLYWLLHEDRPDGPFTEEELRDHPSFSREALVHPDRRIDPKDERWMEAGDMPDLALMLDELDRLAAGEKLVQPQPTVRDLPLLGALIERVQRIEGLALSLRDDLKAREAEFEQIVRQADEDRVRTDLVAGSLEGHESRLQDAEPKIKDLQEGLGKQREAQASTASGLRGLQAELADTQQRAKEAKDELDSLKLSLEATSVDREESRRERDGLRDENDALVKRVDDLEDTIKRLDLRAREEDRKRADEEAERQRSIWSKLPSLGELSFILIPVLLIAAYLWWSKQPKAPADPLDEPPVIEEVAPEPEAAPKKEIKPRKRNRSAREKAEKEARMKGLILLKTTGGVPSSSKKDE